MTGFAEKSASVLLTRISVIILSFFCGAISTRILGPTKRGVLDIMSLLPLFVTNFGHLGIANANLYFVAKKRHPLEKIVANSFSVSTLLGIILIVICYVAFFTFRDSIYKGIPLELTPLAFGIIPFALFHRYTQKTLMGREEVSSRNKIVFYPVLVRFIIIIILMVLLGMQLMGILLAGVGSFLAAYFFCYIYIKKWTIVRWRFDYKLFIESVKFGFVPFLALLVMNLNYRADLFLVKYFVDNTAVGMYSLAVSIVDTIGLLPESIGAVLFARVTSLSEKEANELTPKVCRFSLFICFIGGLSLFGVANFIVPFIYGEDFSASISPLLILIPGTLFLQLFYILHSDLTGRGKAIITVYIFSAAFLINLILNVIFIPRFGINGAALASTVSYALGSTYLACIFSRLTNIKLYRLLFITKADFAFCYFSMSAKLKSFRKSSQNM